MRAGRVSPARTRTAAEPTRCSIAAAVSTDSAHGHTQHTPVGPDTEAAAPPCVCHAGDAAAARERRTVLPDAMQWLWIWCRPVGYRQHGVGRQLSQAGAQSPLLCAPTSTGMACVCIEPAQPRNGRPTGTHSTRQSVLPLKRSGCAAVPCLLLSVRAVGFGGDASSLLRWDGPQRPLPRSGMMLSAVWPGFGRSDRPGSKHR